MAQYQPAPTPSASYPGKTIGLVGMILAIIPCTWFVGLILSIVGFVQSRGAGVKNTPAFAGIIIGAVWLVIDIIAWSTGFATQYMQR